MAPVFTAVGLEGEFSLTGPGAATIAANHSGDCKSHTLRAGVGSQIVQRGKAGLSLLLEARDLAEDLDRDLWDFAVEIETLRSGGLRHSDLRWLLCKGYVEQANEVVPGSGQERRFEDGGALTFTETSCFVVTDVGRELFGQFEDAAPKPLSVASPGDWSNSRGGVSSPVSPGPGDTLQPCWDRDRQELRVGDCVVKQFKVPAPNQEVILAVFHEEGWPVRIDDPLPPRADLEPKRRLHDTINSLNRNQKRSLIRFLGDGTGQGVRWEFAGVTVDANEDDSLATT